VADLLAFPFNEGLMLGYLVGMKTVSFSGFSQVPRNYTMMQKVMRERLKGPDRR
jgi:hypothetical protein